MAKQMRCRITNEHLLSSTVSYPKESISLQSYNVKSTSIQFGFECALPTFQLKQINGYNSFTRADPVSVCAPHLTCCLHPLLLLCFVCIRFNSIAFVLHFDQRHLFSVNWICVCLSVCACVLFARGRKMINQLPFQWNSIRFKNEKKVVALMLGRCVCVWFSCFHNPHRIKLMISLIHAHTHNSWSIGVTVLQWNRTPWIRTHIQTTHTKMAMVSISLIAQIAVAVNDIPQPNTVFSYSVNTSGA